MRTRWNGVAMAASLVALLAACGGGGGDNTVQPPPPSPPPPAPAVAVTDGFSTPAAVKTVSVNGAPATVAARQVLIVLAEDVSAAQLDAVKERLLGLGVKRAGQRLDLRTLVAELDADDGEPAVIAALSAQPGVSHVDYNHVVQTNRSNPAPLASMSLKLGDSGTVPGLQAISTAGRYWVEHIDLAAARAVEDALAITTSPRIAVVDTGIAATQNVLAAGRISRVDARGGALSDDGTADKKSHGLSVTAFAAGESADASGVSRFAPVTMVDVYSDQCTGLLSLLGCPGGIGRVFQTDLAEGIRTAVAGPARVINVSWGDASECKDSESRRLAARREFRAIHAAAVNLARRNDKLMVFSAGNNCEKGDDQLLPRADDPAADSWRSHALIVGASTSTRKDALFSRMGGVVDLMAPGEAVGYGQAVMNGTSFATPLVTGSAALVQGINPELSAPETRYLLIEGAESTVTFANAAAAAFEGYVGRNASGPKRLLNVGNAARAAQLTRGAALKTLPQVGLAKGASKNVEFEVDVPATGVRALDVVFVIDVSGSYGDDIATLKTQANAIVNNLSSRGIDVQFGVTEYSDFPLSPYGTTGDVAFRRLTRITGDKAVVIAGINALTLKSGNDEPESQLEALYQVATGAGRDLNGDGTYAATGGDVAPQPMGFRPGAARVVLFATDARFHDRDKEPTYPGAGYTQTVAALKAAGIRVIALQSGTTSTAAADLARLVGDTGGATFQLSTNSAQIAEAIARGIDTTLAEVEVSAEKVAGAEWIQSIVQDRTKVPAGGKVKFTVTLKGQRAESVDRLAYDLYLWVRANQSALIQRVKIPVEVTR